MELRRLHPGSYPADERCQPLPEFKAIASDQLPLVAQSAKLPISPLAGEMPGRAEGVLSRWSVSQLQPRRQAGNGLIES
ncbi:hypothetical protein BQ8482_180156 [Mesorhizobium delmotii]|uniref:Uncharacterized protein n=1 Tax=Mesorhizobium delmotii TaxID=1631247 RepID=A0A2P9AIH9_9HYPH|nr:hypothetical protein BQ8482_180156 [Mesorhizobium delmotii]